MVMTTDNEPARSAEKQDQIDRDHEELGRNPLEKTDTSREAPASGAGSEPPD
jgi:hypothetical protein